MNKEPFFNNILLDRVFENIYHGTVIVDREGIIQYISKNYCEFLNVERDVAIGEHVTNLIENTRMHLVVQTGKVEIADIQFLRGNFVIANRAPIIENSVIIGAIGTMLYRNVDDWKEINTNIKENLSRHIVHPDHKVNSNGARYYLNDIIGQSHKIHTLKERIKKVARGDISVLIRGESGTGKEMVAHSIHQLSDRSDRAFVKINCSAIPESLLESELFGYEEGAFTGAKKGGKKGKLQLAEGGTVFLDEIGDMSQQMQVKLLRVLQEKEYESLGSLRTNKMNVRFIAATNRPLEKLIKKKLFREDLYYRINAVQVLMPPLRDRIDDLTCLIEHFLRRATMERGKPVKIIKSEVITLFEKYHWPGNIRELENVIEAAVHLSDDAFIKIEDIPNALHKDIGTERDYTLSEILEETEKEVIEKALKKCEFDKKRVTEMLGIGTSTLYDKIKKYNLPVK